MKILKLIMMVVIIIAVLFLIPNNLHATDTFFKYNKVRDIF